MKKYIASVAWVCITVFFSCGDKETDTENGPIKLNPGNDLYGLVTDLSGIPIEGVVVSDGITCVQTDAEGLYQMKMDKDAMFVSYTIPAGYKVASGPGNYPSFYAPLRHDQLRVRQDFMIERLEEPENDFNLICIGDPQVTMSDIIRFRNETAADIKKVVDTMSVPVYALVLGDVSADTPSAFEAMRSEFGTYAAPTFVTIGNHDKISNGGSSVPRDGNLFKTVFGPSDYSFDRGQVHFICMDNVLFTNSENYSAGFTDGQVEWLRQDLSFVPRDKLIILFYHIPMRGSSGGNTGRVLDMLAAFPNVHLMAGHTHYTENYVDKRRNSMYEHIHGAACGMWWFSDLNGCGAPNCYYVYRISGNQITNGVLKGTHHNTDFQIRLHRGADICGGDYETFTYGSLNASFDINTIIANVFNADDTYWQVELFEGDQSRGQMSLLPTCDDAWTVGYHIGVLGKGHTGGSRNLYLQNNKHLYHGRIEGTGGAVRVRAKDRWGNTYWQEEFTAPTDYSSAIKHTLP